MGWFKKKSSQPTGPGFLRHRFLAKAKDLFRRGELEKLILILLSLAGKIPTTESTSQLASPMSRRASITM